MKKVHQVQIILNGYRYVATEDGNNIEISRDGDRIGKAKWVNDQLVLSSALLPDDATLALEKKLKERIDANWDED